MSQTDARRYVAGAALVFGVVLVEVLVIRFGLANFSPEQIAAMDAEIYSVFLLAHGAAGAVGGYLVERRVQAGHLKTGMVVAVLAYLFELAYNLLVLGVVTDVYLFVALLGGATLGSELYRWRSREHSQ